MEIQYKDDPATYIAHAISTYADSFAQWCIGGTTPTRTALDVADEVLQQTRMHLIETAATLTEDTRIIGMDMEDAQVLVLQEAGMYHTGEREQWWVWKDSDPNWKPLPESQRKGVQIQLSNEGKPERMVLHCKRSQIPQVARDLVTAVAATTGGKYA